MSSAFQADGLLIKISKKRCFANEIALSANAEKIEPKILLMDKAVVTLLIRSFFDRLYARTLCKSVL